MSVPSPPPSPALLSSLRPPLLPLLLPTPPPPPKAHSTPRERKEHLRPSPGGWTAFHGDWQDVPEGKRIGFSFKGSDSAAFWHCLREYRTVEGGVYYMGLKQEGGTTHTIFFMLEGEAITLGSGVERATESSLLPHPKRARPDVE